VLLSSASGFLGDVELVHRERLEAGGVLRRWHVRERRIGDRVSSSLLPCDCALPDPKLFRPRPRLLR
jgi:hypothetical protein